MATFTPRLQIVKPAYDESADITTINNAWDVLDGTAGLIICTESTKPTVNLFQGFYIKCTDSGKHYLYQGSDWVEDAYGTINIITVTGSGAVFYGASMTRPFSIGATNGDHSPSVDTAAGSIAIDQTDTGTGTTDGRGLSTSFVTTSSHVAKIGLSAHVGSGPLVPGNYPIPGSNYGLFADDHFSPIRFDLWRNGSFFMTLGRANPGVPSVANQYSVDVLTERMVTLAAGTYNFGVKAVTEQVQHGTGGFYETIYEASFRVELSV